MFGILQPWSTFFMHKAKEYHQAERHVLREALWFERWCFLQRALSSPCPPTPFPLLLTCGVITTSNSAWLSGQVVLAHSSVWGFMLGMNPRFDFCCWEHPAFSPPTGVVKGGSVQVRTLIGPHNHSYKTCFSSGIKGSEKGWNWSSHNHSLGDSEDKVTNVAPV